MCVRLNEHFCPRISCDREVLVIGHWARAYLKRGAFLPFRQFTLTVNVVDIRANSIFLCQQFLQKGKNTPRFKTFMVNFLLKNFWVSNARCSNSKSFMAKMSLNHVYTSFVSCVIYQLCGAFSLHLMSLGIYLVTC